jgi:hypothetical protein
MNLPVAQENSRVKEYVFVMGVSVGDMVDWWVKDFVYMHFNVIIDLNSLYCIDWLLFACGPGVTDFVFFLL